MTHALVIEETGFGLRAARLEDDRLVEIVDLDHDQARVTDRLFAARVTRVEPKMGAAFLDIGLEQNAFLNVKDARHMPGADPRMPIERILAEGQRIVVMGLREAVDEKGPRVTCDIRLIGLHLVLRPSSEAVEVSGNLGKRQQFELKERARELFPKGGVLLRRGAQNQPDDVLLAEQEELRRRWHGYLDLAKKKSGPLDADDTVERLLRTLLGNPVEVITVADPGLAAQIRSFRDAHMAGSGPLVELIDGDAFEATGVAEQIDAALQSEVRLPDGGRIWIERTRALTAIDVDAGGQASFRVNIAAAHEIARQLRLRNIGGIIVVDFVDLVSKNERFRVIETLKRALAADPVPGHVHDVSPQGLIEIGRPRRGIGLDELMLRPCNHCLGEGTTPSLRSRAEALVRALRRSPRLPEQVAVARDLGRYLQDGAGAAALAASGFKGRLSMEPSLRSGAFQLS
ncbi:MAG TPA: ribonuclease E/G [Geminicoccus sp.]|jgi:ribonuclease G|uniref:ribonuclease E/G n=1 Tax=Geminicoccus sp. TaxID=2024832 RepID=UPI002E359018|nr:ribonuclease E/G [Geminicoccus sp.]HEX2527465.1 ribonuclease E/G [Geminicoccus sp.]